MTKLTDSQRALILLATQTDGRIENYPKNLGGGARTAVVRGLLREDLIAADGSGYALTAAGYEAVGRTPPQASSDTDADADSEADADIEAEVRADTEADHTDDPTLPAGDEPAQSNTETSEPETAPASDARRHTRRA